MITISVSLVYKVVLVKDALLESKRALIRVQKGIFCKLIKRLFGGKRSFAIFFRIEVIFTSTIFTTHFT